MRACRAAPKVLGSEPEARGLQASGERVRRRLPEYLLAVSYAHLELASVPRTAAKLPGRTLSSTLRVRLFVPAAEVTKAFKPK